MTAVLDHGYVTLVERWGSDERVIEAARMSTDGGFRGWGSPDAPGDEKLLRYLWTHQHSTPFEMAGLIVEVMAPIFVLREWHRHRTQSFNELSARYTPLPDLCYVPTTDRLMAAKQSTANRQGSEDGFTRLEAVELQNTIERAYADARAQYGALLAGGVAREVARLVVPVGQYSRMRASANLRNWLAFLRLRLDASAQFEIREYANAVGNLIGEAFPKTWALFQEGTK